MEVSFVHYIPEKKRSISYVNDWRIEKKFFAKLTSFKEVDFYTMANKDKKYGGFDVESQGSENYRMLENQFSGFGPREFFYHFRIDDSLFRVFAGKKINDETMYILIIDSKGEINHK